LVRWHHPPRGPLWPAEFIPIAEQAGLVHHIGEWVLLEACAQARTWTERGCPPVRIAINVSAREIRSHALIERVQARRYRPRLYWLQPSRSVRPVPLFEKLSAGRTR
jgi:EAL domain-containing protein (putative c-di-GMP-specific phosphodiesterase class I)